MNIRTKTSPRHLERGIVQIYTGDGKGKTSAAVGIAIRAAGSNLKVAFFQFFKKPISGELAVLRKLENVHFYSLAAMHPGFQYFSEDGLRKYRMDFRNTWKKVMLITRKNRYDVIVMDEILIALRDGFIDENALMKFIGERNSRTEIIMTGRHITKGLMEKADLVTEIKKVKHPFPEIESRKGIDY